MSKRGASGDSSAGKLARLGRDSYVSQAGIASLMRTVRDEGIPEFTSRATQYRARTAMTADLLKDIALSRHDGGEDVIVTLQDPLTMLAHMAERSEHFAHVLRETAAKHPCTSNEPWHIAIYQDGVDPSDGLAKNHSRRCAVFYWSVREFGPAFLAREELWFTPLVVRKDMVNVIDGRHERLAKLLLRSFVEPIDATADGTRKRLAVGTLDKHTVWIQSYNILAGFLVRIEAAHPLGSLRREPPCCSESLSVCCFSHHELRSFRVGA